MKFQKGSAFLLAGFLNFLAMFILLIDDKLGLALFFSFLSLVSVWMAARGK